MKEMSNPLGRSVIFRGFKRALKAHFGAERAQEIWREANGNLLTLRQAHPEIKGDSAMIILPAAALHSAIAARDAQAADMLLADYGKRVGEKIAGVVRVCTSIPGVPELLWKNMPRLMRSMSSEKAGYTRRIVSETDSLVGVDILSCPLHDAAVVIGVPQAARMVCAMDKAYMTGFRRIRYTRTTSVAEGDECCDYRLSYDRDKR